MTQTDNDKRHFQRILCNGQVLLVHDDREFGTELLDLSLKGVLARRPPNWDIGEGSACELEVKLDDADFPIIMMATVSHLEDGRIGFACRHIDLDSISQLRRMIEVNLADPSELERELSALGE